MSTDELDSEVNTAYKIGEKKTVDEYAKLDENDESLRKWKESLGITSGATGGSIGAPGDKRRVVILQIGLKLSDRPDIIIDLEAPNALENLKKNPLIIKEGTKYRIYIRYRIQHEIVTGLRYLQLTKRKGIRVDKIDEVCGSYVPNTLEKPYYESEFAEEEAPSGFIARGVYDITSKFTDDDKANHLQVSWQLEVKKSWS